MRRLAALNGNASGTRVDIICQTRGATVTGKFGTSTWWNKIGASRYVSDAFVHTGSDGRVAPLCTSGSTNPAPTGAIKDDYPYRGATSGVDRWDFYKGPVHLVRRVAGQPQPGHRVPQPLQGRALGQRRELGQRGPRCRHPRLQHPACR